MPTWLPIDPAKLPALNAALNFTSLLLLIAAYIAIRSRHVTAHKWLMTSAFGVSVLFLVSYLTKKFTMDDHRFGGEGPVRYAYFILLITHVTLAATVPFLAVRMLYLGYRGLYDRHRRLARYAFPIWVYVSVTGVLVYFMLFRWFTPLPPATKGDTGVTQTAVLWKESSSCREL